MGEPESLDTDEPLPRHVARHDYDRLLMLSDGVFAIAMTLLVLEVRPEPGPATLWAGLAPVLGAFALSFAVTAVFWQTHKRLFARTRRADGGLTVLNLVLLGLIALVPAGTGLITRSGLGGEGTLIYLALIGLIGLVQSLAWLYAGFGAKLLHADVTSRIKIVAAVFSAVMPITLAGMSLYAAASRSFGVGALTGVLAVGLVVLRSRLTRGEIRPPRSEAPDARS